MRKIFAASALALLLLSGCATIDSGKIVDMVQQSSTEYECKDKTTGTGKNKKTTRVCDWDTDQVCRFWLEDASGERGWLEVDCATTYNEYRVGEQYPR